MSGVVRPGVGQLPMRLPRDDRVGPMSTRGYGERRAMAARRRWFLAGILASVVLASGRAEGSGELKLSKDFLGAIVEKLPPCPFDKADRYRGSVHSFRLDAIEPRTRRLLIGCQIEGEFHPPVTGPISERAGRSPDTPEGWASFASKSKPASTSNRAQRGTSVSYRNRRSQAARA